MKKKQQKVQLILITIGLLLIIVTYLYYPYINKSKIFANKADKKVGENIIEDKSGTVFENVEYKGLYDLDKPFVVKSDSANIKDDEPDVVYMKNMHVILYLSDGRIVNITSNKGRYNKATYDCFFEDDVKATDEDTIITAENLDLLATNNSVEIYNSVDLKYTTGSLKADKIDYDFETKFFKVSMFDKNKIKMKITR